MERRNPPAGVRTLLHKGEVRLADCGIDSARLDCELLLAHVLGIERGGLIGLASDDDLAPEIAAAFRALIARRAQRLPLAHLTGHREFWSLDLEVGPDVLIPRPETETLVEESLARLPRPDSSNVPLKVWDVGTGSGAVAIALASERRDLALVASDISPAALAVAARNVLRHSVAERVAILQADLLDPALCPSASLSMVVSNPPYVGTGEREALMPEVRDHEPVVALFAGPEGLDVIRRLAPQAGDALVSGGWLVMEVSALHADAVVALLEGAGIWQDIGVRADLAGRPRVVRAQRKMHEEHGK